MEGTVASLEALWAWVLCQILNLGVLKLAAMG